MKYLDKFEKVKIPVGSCAEFPLDLLSPGDESETVIFLARNLSEVGVLFGARDYILIPLLNIQDKTVIETLAQNLCLAAESHPKYKLSRRRKRQYLYVIRDWEIGLAIL